MSVYTFQHLSRKVLRRHWPIQTDNWLGGDEYEKYATFQHPRRQEAWLLGRILAKHLIQTAIGKTIQPRDIQIYTHDGLGQAIRPLIFLRGQLQNWSLSISHSNQSVLVAFSDNPETTIGVDITPIQKMSNSFVKTWFTPNERHWLACQQHQKQRQTCILWAIKEAFYKASHQGEGFAPHHIEVCIHSDKQYRVQYTGNTTIPHPSVQISATVVNGETIAIVTTNKPSLEDNI